MEKKDYQVHQGEGEGEGPSQSQGQREGDDEDEDMPFVPGVLHIEGGAGGAIGGAIGGFPVGPAPVLGGMIDVDAIPAEVLFLGDPLKKSTQFFLSERQELEVVEWLRAHPMFYRKTDPEYKRRDRKRHLMKQLAERLKVHHEGLYKWCKGMRDRYERMVWEDKRSVRPRLRRSPKDEWILANFSFMHVN